MKFILLTLAIFNSFIEVQADDSYQRTNEEPHYAAIDRNDNFTCKIFDYLEKIKETAKSIKNNEEKSKICLALQCYQDKLKQDCLDRDYSKLIEDLTFFHENIDEILADCNDIGVRAIITAYLNEMIRYLNLS